MVHFLVIDTAGRSPTIAVFPMVASDNRRAAMRIPHRKRRRGVDVDVGGNQQSGAGC